MISGIKDILKIVVPEEFGCSEEGDITSNMDEVMEQLPRSCKTLWGITQFCIIFPDTNEVIKIPFNGLEYCYYDEDEERDITYFSRFHDCRDYCTRSFNLYELAEDFGIEQILAKIDYLGTSADGHTKIYLQEKVDTFNYSDGSKRYFKTEERRNKSKEKLLKLQKNSKLRWSFFPTDWIAAALDFYGEDFMKHFLTFCRDNDLSDFHEGNVGWRKDGTPVILDWAGFYS